MKETIFENNSEANPPPATTSTAEQASDTGKEEEEEVRPEPTPKAESRNLEEKHLKLKTKM